METGARVTPASLFTLNSSTKAFTGVAIMQLVQEGKVRGIRFSTLSRMCDVLGCKPGDLLDHDADGRGDADDPDDTEGL